MNKRGASVEETILFLGKLLLVAAFLIVIFIFFTKISAIFKPDDATIDSFKTLTSEINILIDDLKEDEEKTSQSITVPIYIKKDHIIRALNYQEGWGLERNCGKSSCLLLSSLTKRDNIMAYFPIDNTEFEEQGVVIKSTLDRIYRVKFDLEKRDGKFYLRISQLE